MSGTPEVSEGFTTAPGSENTKEDSSAPGTTVEGRPGMEVQDLKPLLTDLREASSGT